jgi:hypothetical protein
MAYVGGGGLHPTAIVRCDMSDQPRWIALPITPTCLASSGAFLFFWPSSGTLLDFRSHSSIDISPIASFGRRHHERLRQHPWNMADNIGLCFFLLP